MNSTQTATTDGFGRSVQITNGRFVATMMTGLLPVADMVSRIQLLAPFEQALEQTHKPKDRSLYSAGAMFRQRVFAHICGFEDLADHDVITEDEGFLSALGVNDAAGSSTLCRFENSITRHDLDRLNCCFWTHCFGPTESIASFPGPGPGRLGYSPRPAWLTAPSVNSLITKLSPGSRNVGSSPDDSMTLVPNGSAPDSDQHQTCQKGGRRLVRKVFRVRRCQAV